MKNILNTIKLTVIATAIGETIASYYKDKKFKENLENANGFEKLKIVFNNLIDLNKGFFTEVKSVDYQSYYREYKMIAEEKINLAKEQLELLKEKAESYKDDKVIPMIDSLQEKVIDIKKQLETKIDDVKERVKLEETIENIKKKAEEIKTKLKK